jgi:hypothetical protein
MATTKEGQVTLAVPADQAARRVLDAMQALGWPVKQVDEANSLIEATTSVSLASWGEKVSVRLASVDGGTEVAVRSAARLKTNVTAAGRNRKNVEALIGRINAQ